MKQFRRIMTLIVTIILIFCSMNPTIVNAENNNIGKDNAQSSDNYPVIMPKNNGNDKMFETLNELLSVTGINNNNNGKKVEIAFVIDSTGSMDEYISGVKNSVTEFAGYMENLGVDLRMSVVEYRDITIDGDDSTIVHLFNHTPWHHSTEQLVSSLSEIRVDGGGDTEETLIDGLGCLLKWHNDFENRIIWSSDSYKFAFVLTDAGYKTDNNYGYNNMHDITEDLINNDIAVSVITKSKYYEEYNSLTEETGGILANINSDNYVDMMKSLADQVLEMTEDSDEIVVTVKAFTNEEMTKKTIVPDAIVSVFVGDKVFYYQTGSDGTTRIPISDYTKDELSKATISAHKEYVGTVDSSNKRYPLLKLFGTDASGRAERFIYELHSEKIDLNGNWRGEKLVNYRKRGRLELDVTEPRFRPNISISYFEDDSSTDLEKQENLSLVKGFVSKYSKELAQATDGHVMINKVLIGSTDKRTKFYLGQDNGSVELFYNAFFAGMADIRLEGGRHEKGIVHSNAYYYGFYNDVVEIVDDGLIDHFKNINESEKKTLSGKLQFQRIQQSWNAWEGEGTASLDGDLYKTTTHESGHYVLGFWDEYNNANGEGWNRGKYGNIPEGAPDNFGLMDSGDSTEISNNNDYVYLDGNWLDKNINTEQSYKHGYSCEDCLADLLESGNTNYREETDKMDRRCVFERPTEFFAYYSRSPVDRRYATYDYAGVSDSAILYFDGNEFVSNEIPNVGSVSSKTSSAEYVKEQIAEISVDENGRIVILPKDKEMSYSLISSIDGEIPLIKNGEHYIANMSGTDLHDLTVIGEKNGNSYKNDYYYESMYSAGLYYNSPMEGLIAYVIPEEEGKITFMSGDIEMSHDSYNSIAESVYISSSQKSKGEVYAIFSGKKSVNIESVTWFKYSDGNWKQLETDLSQEENLNIGARCDYDGMGLYVLMAKDCSKEKLLKVNNVTLQNDEARDGVVLISFSDPNDNTAYYEILFGENNLDSKISRPVGQGYYAIETGKRNADISVSVVAIGMNGARSDLSTTSNINTGESDRDRDGIPDWYCDEFGLWPKTEKNKDIAGSDEDNDGLTNLEEYKRGSDPQNPNDPFERVAVKAIELRDSKVYAEINESVILTADIKPLDATNQRVHWYVDKDGFDVVEIDESGLSCTLIGRKEGKARIDVVTEDGGYYDSCEIEITTGVTLEDNASELSTTLLPGEIRRLSVSKKGRYIYGIKWETTYASPKGCITMKNGVVTAKKAGTAKVTASYGSSKVEFNITVDGSAPKGKTVSDGKKTFKLTAPKTVNAKVGEKKKVSIGIPANMRNGNADISVETVDSSSVGSSGSTSEGVEEDSGDDNDPSKPVEIMNTGEADYTYGLGKTPDSILGTWADSDSEGINGNSLKPTGGDYTTIKDPQVGDNSTTWDCIWFGNYWQEDTNGDGYCFEKETVVSKNEDGDRVDQDGTLIYDWIPEGTYPADKKQPIKWRVLDIDSSGNALLLADKLIDIVQYNETETKATWETCSMRSYLNGYDSTHNVCNLDFSGDKSFIYKAFSETERNNIKNSDLTNPDNPIYGNEGGNATQDKIFCLSYEEAMNTDYGFLRKLVYPCRFTEDDPTRVAVTTKYTDNKLGYTGQVGWWLRSPCYNGGYASNVNRRNGSVDSGYLIVSTGIPDGYARPAFRMNLSSSSSLWTYAGTVRSDGTVNQVGVSVKDVMLENQKAIKKTIRKDSKYTLLPQFIPSNAYDKTIDWSVSEGGEVIISIDNCGVVSGLKEGTATVTAKTQDGGHEASCMITVVGEDNIADPIITKDKSTWDCIWFGNYWQEDTNGDGHCFEKETVVSKNGDGNLVDQDGNLIQDRNPIFDKIPEGTYPADKKQPIKWRVLDVDEYGNALLLADKLIDYVFYNEFNKILPSVSWENCTIRSYLNGYGSAQNVNHKDFSDNKSFIYNAFQEKERDQIITSVISNPNNPVYGTSGGNTTQDKIFCLSLSEATTGGYGFIKNEFPNEVLKIYSDSTDSDSTRVAVPTKFTNDKPGYGFYGATAGKPAQWWLRSPGNDSYYASNVNSYGAVHAHGDVVSNIGNCVRPAFRMNLLSSSSLWSYAGTVCSDGTVFEPAEPKAVAGVSLQKTAKIFARKTLLLTPKISPSDSMDKTVTWESSALGIASVDADGVVTGIREGTTMITVTTNDGGFTASCTVTVEPLSSVPTVKITKPVTIDEGSTTWDCIWFGNYWQDDTNGDGYCFSKDTVVSENPNSTGSSDKYIDETGEVLYHFTGETGTYLSDSKQPIKWRVLDIDAGGNALLLADKLIDTVQYNETNAEVTWETCTMRSYLNGYGNMQNILNKDFSGEKSFLYNAFSETERNNIKNSDLTNPNNPVYGTLGGKATQDKIFSLSLDEAMTAGYGFIKNVFIEEAPKPPHTDRDPTRKAYSTKFTDDKRVFVFGNYSFETINWWLRSPGYDSSHASDISSSGDVNAYFPSVSGKYCCVRPAFRMNLSSSSSLWTYAGTVSSDGTVVEPKAVTGVSLPKTASVEVGKTITLTPEISPSNATNQKVTWKSSVPSVASVSTDGTVTGIKAGMSIITVTTNDGGYEASCTVTVTDSTSTEVKVTGVELNPPQNTVATGKTTKLSPIIKPSNATNQKVTWKSSVPSVASVSTDGTVTGIKAGMSIITVTTNDGGYEASCTVTVTDNSSTEVKVTGVELNPTQNTVAAGKTTKLSPNIKPSNATNQKVTWKSSVPSVASVSTDGTVTGIKAGTTRVTVTTDDGGFEAYCDITVKETVDNLTTENLKIKWLGYNNYDRTKATKGFFEIEALDVGTTYVVWTMTDENGKEVSAVTKVIVKKPITELHIAEKESSPLTLNAGEGKRLTVTGTKGNTDSKDLSFIVNGKGVKVSKSGYVVATTPGSEATVTVKAGKVSDSIRVSVPSSGRYLSLNKTTANIKIPKSAATKNSTVALKLTNPKKKEDQPNVTWSVAGDPEGITVFNGVVSVGSYANPGCYTVTATPEEASSGYNPACCELIVK